MLFRSPFFNDYNELVQRVDEQLESHGHGQACGRDHIHCCRTPVRLTLAGAVFLSHRINLELSGEDRLSVIERAVETAQTERKAAAELGKDPGSEDYCLSEVGSWCPLLKDDKCMLFDHRPLQCRAFGLDESIEGGLWEEKIGRAHV